MKVRSSEVTLHVEGEVVAAREGALAQLTLKRPDARVLAEVARQLVAARKLPAAALPGAVVGLLARVRPHVRLQVRALRVRLAALPVRALVDTALPCLRRLRHRWVAASKKKNSISKHFNNCFYTE